ncbi:hypothetical protein K439DRAFT_1344089 [Ramaria rubella]|nr:hypothetical protein K439DRAFT_1344089 [Ramaria rubella]
MTPHRQWFTPGSYMRLDTPRKVHFGDNSFVEASGIGTMDLTSKVSGQTKRITLTGVLYVPAFSLTLVSVHHLANQTTSQYSVNKPVES